MKHLRSSIALLLLGTAAHAQTNPAITAWLRNTTGATGCYYLSGGTSPVTDTTQANVQQVQYSANYAYIKATGIPTYAIGPYALGAITRALNNNYIFKIPLNPAPATSLTTVQNGATAVFINGTVSFAARDAATYMSAGQWHQNAVYFENLGFDCAHGHPGPMTADYHVHQNPSAYNVSATPTSSICNVYLSDGLYVPQSTMHSPLIGFAPDGYPIYGAYGYSVATDASSPLRRMETSYRLRTMTSRTTLPDGTAATGPTFTEMISSMIPGSTPLPASLGAYEEDYEYVAGLGDLDEHNGRFCKTPEYPSGIYCYFATIDADKNPVYPYLIGLTYYGVVPASAPGPGGGFTHSTITETVTTYTPVSVADTRKDNISVSIFPNPANDVIAVQSSLAKATDRKVQLVDMTGRVVEEQTLYQGSTLCYFNVELLYAGTYIVNVIDGATINSSKIIISR